MCRRCCRSAFAADDQFKLFRCIGNASCDAQLAPLRNDGLYTPPSTQGTLLFPMTGGGVNWGGAAFDPVNQILYANVSHAVHIIKLIPRAEAEGMTAAAAASISGRSAARRLR